jgi:hypothetical protein
MVKAIRLYVEGDKSLREGFHRFFGEMVALSRARKIGWELILCGSRDRAYQSFINALTDHPSAFSVLLVDAEGPVQHPPWEHLRLRDGDHWRRPQGIDDSQCQLMVQAMEAWFIADIPALRDFYKSGLRENALPSKVNGRVEQIPKQSLEPALRAATKETRKGPYHKTNHAPELLKRIRPERVRLASEHCERLFATIHQKVSELPHAS